MSFREAQLSLQLAAEERLGFVERERLRLAKAREDAAAGALQGALNGGRP